MEKDAADMLVEKNLALELSQEKCRENELLKKGEN